MILDNKFERKYKLNKHLESKNERKYSSGVLKLLFAETSNRCPICNVPLNWNYKGEISSHYNQIAHIYGRKLFAKFSLPLTELYHIDNIDELDKYHNLIILCERHHKEYDNKPTYKKYVEILDIKRNLTQKISDESLIYFSVVDILELIEEGAFQKLRGDKLKLGVLFKKTKLRKKMKHNKINELKTSKTVENMKLYYRVLNKIFEDMDNEDHILKQYNNVYNKLKMNNWDRNSIIDLINETLCEGNSSINKEVILLITDYMIMTCEVLDNVD